MILPLLMTSSVASSSATQIIAVSVDVKKIFSYLKLGSDFVRSSPKAIPSERNEQDNWQRSATTILGAGWHGILFGSYR